MEKKSSRNRATYTARPIHMHLGPFYAQGTVPIAHRTSRRIDRKKSKRMA
jgi:hypothetical protein